MKQPLWFCSCKLWVKERLSLKQNNFFSFILCYKVLLPYVTNFLSVLTFANERVKIFCLDLFLWVLQKIMFHVLIFVVSPKFAKLQNFVHAQIYCCKVHLLASVDKKLHIMEKKEVQHQTLDQTKVCVEILDSQFISQSIPFYLVFHLL